MVFSQRFYSATGASKKPDARQIEMMARSLPHRKKLKDVANIIVVASGKGGVGKTTTAVNLAISLSNEGKTVGILDGDIFGPTVPLMMNIKETPLVDDNNMVIPPINYGVKCLSMGLLVEDSSAVIWRGPLVMSALQRLLKGTIWVMITTFTWNLFSIKYKLHRDHWTFLLWIRRPALVTFIYHFHKTFLYQA